MGGYNIKTSAFRVDGISSDVYISDLPNSDRETGELFLFSVPSINSSSPTIIRRNIGTIDYNRGVLTLNPINVLSGLKRTGQTIIEISGTPVSNDVVGLQDLYLQLDVANSSFETVTDEIASGVDPSASNYIVSSSYANGVLVRPGGRGSVPVSTTTTTTTATGNTTLATVSGRTSPSAPSSTGTSTTQSSSTSSSSTPSSSGGSYSSGY